MKETLTTREIYDRYNFPHFRRCVAIVYNLVATGKAKRINLRYCEGDWDVLFQNYGRRGKPPVEYDHWNHDYPKPSIVPVEQLMPPEPVQEEAIEASPITPPLLEQCGSKGLFLRIFASDWHTAKAFQLDGFNAKYNVDILKRRVIAYANKIIAITKDINAPILGVIYHSIGDMMEGDGFVYKGQFWHLEIEDVAEQESVFADIESDFLVRVYEGLGRPKMKGKKVAGNHDMRRKESSNMNMAASAHNIVKRQTPFVEWQYSDDFIVDQEDGLITYTSHGRDMGASANVFETRGRNKALACNAQLLVTGHAHKMRNSLFTAMGKDIALYGNGSLCGYDPFAETKGFVPVPVGQTILFTEPELKIIWSEHRIYLGGVK